jgi:hypothetical protein
MEPTLEMRIRQRAYEIWNESGRRDGEAQLHWLAAEHELLSATGHPAVAMPAAQKSAVRKSSIVGKRPRKR